MEETPQENQDSNLVTPLIEENKDSKKAEIEKSDSVETNETMPENQEENAEENTDDYHSENENEKTESDCSDHSGGESDDASVILEREEGDGQESTPNRKVDDDEDKRNPQYIPKRGTFYEHDDRTAQDEEGEEVGEIPENERSEKDGSKKKVWSEKEGSKWSHDRFNDSEQAPKSRAELVSIYGYDIRNEEGPPRARRRRRYGRGPNKYTRNWEDEEAYSKPTNVVAKPVARKPRRAKDGEEFPPLVSGGGSGSGGGGSLSDTRSPEPSDHGAGGDTLENTTPPVKTETSNDAGGLRPPDQFESEALPARNAHTASRPQRGGSRVANRKEEPPKAPPGSGNTRGVTKTRGFFKNGVRALDNSTRARNQKNQQKEEDYADYIMSQNFTNKSHNNQQQGVQKIEKDMANMSMQHQEFTGGSGNTSRGGKFSGGPRQTSVPPRLQNEQRGSKRYSSIRQRSLPETAATPQFGQHPQFYQGADFTPDYASQPPSGGQPAGGAGLLPHPPASGASVPLNGATHVLQAPPFPQGYPQHPPPPPAAFLQPVQPPVQPLFPQQPPPPPQIINFAQAPPQPYAQPPYTNYQHQQFNPVTQAPPPAELYQPQGGITYYSTQNQQLLPRVPQKRVKSAIPIVPPPEHKEPRGRGRLSQAEESSPVGGPPEEPLPHDTANTAPLVVQQ